MQYFKQLLEGVEAELLAAEVQLLGRRVVLEAFQEVLRLLRGELHLLVDALALVDVEDLVDAETVDQLVARDHARQLLLLHLHQLLLLLQELLLLETRLRVRADHDLLHLDVRNRLLLY